MKSDKPLIEILKELYEAKRHATPGKWSWWTSNSMRRLSSDDSGKDGDVLHAFIATDGVPCVHVNEEDMKLIELSHNYLGELLRYAELWDILCTIRAEADKKGIDVLIEDAMEAAMKHQAQLETQRRNPHE